MRNRNVSVDMFCCYEIEILNSKSSFLNKIKSEQLQKKCALHTLIN